MILTCNKYIFPITVALLFFLSDQSRFYQSFPLTDISDSPRFMYIFFSERKRKRYPAEFLQFKFASTFGYGCLGMYISSGWISTRIFLTTLRHVVPRCPFIYAAYIHVHPEKLFISILCGETVYVFFIKIKRRGYCKPICSVGKIYSFSLFVLLFKQISRWMQNFFSTRKTF
jgi:hypothetical protein